ncbi:uncharacterized protein MONBRDRAFT_27531 [Monosiga brevicollis MX1]|uniref:Receptor for retinol uptake STRA6 n=1 Tax=Monosiga brevicollis TaxID=81824 RepID=A9V5J7_MONBE|nr:uncharacterized protein MONBRDRAFT_27531 [Monosiga brevicollis MX1]EDQ87295.1 predicted protein [Monosiga brevicollis MX1]|eukprot:XP_001747908.1 hypothetical protein [Monosiga brevicollis MX1]
MSQPFPSERQRDGFRFSGFAFIFPYVGAAAFGSGAINLLCRSPVAIASEFFIQGTLVFRECCKARAVRASGMLGKRPKPEACPPSNRSASIGRWPSMPHLLSIVALAFVLVAFMPHDVKAITPEQIQSWLTTNTSELSPTALSRLQNLPPTLYFTLPDDSLLRYSRENPHCGRSSNSSFCLQSRPTSSWLGLVAAHFPTGIESNRLQHLNDTQLVIVGSRLVNVSESADHLGAFAALYLDLATPALSTSLFGTKVEMAFTCDRNITLPDFPAVAARTTDGIEAGIPTRRYHLDVHHDCACHDPHDYDKCSYFSIKFDKVDAVTHWRNSADERQGDVTKCMKSFTNDLSFLWGLSLGIILLDIERCPDQGNCLSRLRPADVIYERPLGTLRYVLTFGWMDALTPPAHLLETDEIAWPTAAGFGAISIVVPAFTNNALPLTGILTILIFFIPLILCKYARTQTIGLVAGAAYSVAVLEQVWSAIACFGERQSAINVLAMIPPTVCITYLAAWYWWQIAKRAQYLYDRLKGNVHEEPTWRELQINKLDRRPYIRALLARVPRASLTPSFGYQAFRATLTGADHYMVPTRLLCAVGLSICCTISITPSMYSAASLLGAMAEFAMSSGHCCEGRQCDPTPGAELWVADWLTMGVGVQLGHGEECRKDQIVIRHALSAGIPSAATLVGFALCISLMHTLVVYRKRMLLLFRGQPDFIIKPVPVRESISAALKYGGTQVASTLAALALGTVVFTVLAIFIVITTVLPIMNLYGDWFWPWWFRFAIFDAETGQPGFLAMVLVNYWTLMLITWLAFRMDPNDRGLQRRGLFHVFDCIEFIFYLFNALLGLAKRAITSILLQVIFMGRMDKSLMPRKHELMDKSYVSYLGYMQLDLFYSHPILLTACYFWLLEVEPPFVKSAYDVHPSLGTTAGTELTRRANSQSLHGSTAVFKTLPNNAGDEEEEDQDGLINGDTHAAAPTPARSGASLPNHRRIRSDVSVLMDEHEASRARRRRIRNRVWLCVTLVHNPRLRKFRKHVIRAELAQVYERIERSTEQSSPTHHLNPLHNLLQRARPERVAATRSERALTSVFDRSFDADPPPYREMRNNPFFQIDDSSHEPSSQDPSQDASERSSMDLPDSSRGTPAQPRRATVSTTVDEVASDQRPDPFAMEDMEEDEYMEIGPSLRLEGEDEEDTAESTA